MNAPFASSYTLAELAQRLGAVLEGDGTTVIEGVSTLERGGPRTITFFTNSRYRAQLGATRAAAIVIGPGDAPATSLPKLISDNPYATFAKIATLLRPDVRPDAGRDPTARIDPTATVAPTAHIGAFAVIGARAVIGERATIGAHCVIGDDCSLADDVLLHPRVTLYPRSVIGARTIIHSGAVLGADGFGMAEDRNRWVKFPQLGRVVVGNDVEIGANTTIDRGAIDDTLIEDDVKLDNQIQIGHNCVIGTHTAIAGCVGIAGSARIGRNCKIGGASMIAGHLTIADGTVVSGATTVYESIAEPAVYTSIFPALPHRTWRHVAAQVKRLRDLAQRVAALEHASKPRDD